MKSARWTTVDSNHVTARHPGGAYYTLYRFGHGDRWRVTRAYQGDCVSLGTFSAVEDARRRVAMDYSKA